MKKKNKNYRNIPHPLMYKNFFGYISAHIKHISITTGIREIYMFLKKYLFLGRIIRIIRFVFIWLQTSAYFIFFSLFFFTLIPVFILALSILYLFSVCRHKKHNRYFHSLIDNNCFVINFISSYEEYIHDERNQNNLYIYVLKRPLGMLPYAVKKIDSNNYFISLSYFYCLKKHILDKNKEKTIYLRKDET